MRTIKLMNSKGRDADIASQSVNQARRVRWLDDQGRQVRNVKVVRATLDHDLDQLQQQFAEPSQLAKALIDGDPEIDLERYGSFLEETSRVYVDPDRKILYSVQEWEIVRAPDGTEKERRPRVVSQANAGVEAPLRWSGKLMARKAVYNRFVFSLKQQLVHVNGLTYDFLYGIAKELEEKDSLLLVGAGPKSNTPLIFQRGGTAYRGFLEGRTQGDKYCLLLHLSNLELKGLPT
jgi:hypothetical protein